MESEENTVRGSRADVAELVHSGIAAWVVLGVSLIITLMGWAISSAYVEQRAQDRFRYAVDSAVQAIAKRMQEYEQVLRGGVGLLQASQFVSRKEWNRYVSTLQIDTYWPGIQGIGYAEMIAPEDLVAHEARLRAEGFDDYAVAPRGDREQYSAIVYLEPFSGRNIRAFGYDMYSDPVRREAMQRAADTAEPALSGKVTLVQETDKDVQAGFLVYLPHYRSGVPLHTVEERRQALLGFVYSAFRVRDLMQGILGRGVPHLDFQVYDGDSVDPSARLYDSRDRPTVSGRERGRFSSVRPLALQGRNWTVVMHSSEEFDRELASSQPMLIAGGGLVVDVLLFAVILSLYRERRSSTRHARELALALDDLQLSEHRLQRTAEVARIGSWQLDLRTQQLTWSDETYRICGLAAGAPVGQSRCQEMMHPADRERFENAWQAALDGRPFDLEVRILIGEEVRWLHMRAEFLFDDLRRAHTVLGSLQDITARKRWEQQLHLAARVIEHAREGVMITDAQVRLVDVNPMFTEITGYERHEVLGRDPSLLSSGRHDKAFYAAMWKQIHTTGGWEGEIWSRRRNGELFVERLSISAVTAPDSDEVVNYVGMMSDVTEAHRQKEHLEYLAHHDVLTGLPNRYLLMDRLEVAIAHAQRRQQKLSLAFVDLDDFKPINDNYGHAQGDKALVEVARRLRRTLRGEDSVARLGGDEFAMLFVADETRDEEVWRVPERLLQVLSQPYRLDGLTLHMSASIGVAMYPDDEQEASRLLLRADMAMYRAKSTGRGRICFAAEVAEQDGS